MVNRQGTGLLTGAWGPSRRPASDSHAEGADWPPCGTQVMAISQMMRSEFAEGQSISGIGGVESGGDAAEFLLLGAQTVQVGARR